MQTIDLTKPATQEAIASIIGASRQTVSSVEMDGICTRDMPLGDWLKDYIEHLRETAAGRLGTGGLDLVNERARLARAQAERVEMQNAVSRGELAPTALLEEVLAAAAAKVAGVFDAIPGMVRRRIPGLPIEAVDLIAAEIVKARNTVAGMSLSDLQENRTEEGGELKASEPSAGVQADDAQGGSQ